MKQLMIKNKKMTVKQLQRELLKHAQGGYVQGLGLSNCIIYGIEHPLIQTYNLQDKAWWEFWRRPTILTFVAGVMVSGSVMGSNYFVQKGKTIR